MLARISALERSARSKPSGRSEPTLTASERAGALRPAAPLSPSVTLELQRRVGNRAVVKLVQRDAVTDVDGHSKLESRTAYLGFNPDAGQEAAKLKAKLGAQALISLYDADERANLAKPEDITWFIGIDLGVPVGTDQFKVLDTLFNAVNQDSRAHLADLAKMLAGAENDQYILDRLILSGHSDGVAVWG